MMTGTEARPMHMQRWRWRAGLALAAAVATATGVAWAQQLPSRQELRQQFLETDRNGDGKIDREEFHRRTVEAFYFLDKDRKGYLVFVDLRGLSSENFKAADRQGDGKLSLDEFVNARFRQFDLADTSGDGVLTIEEIEIYVDRLR